jgi:hypothetical protein
MCWDTWFSNILLRYPHIKPLFIYGTPAFEKEPRFIRESLYWIVPSLDDYHNLPHRTYDLLRFALTMNDWDYIFKCDDDTYIHPDRFANFDPNPYQYLGSSWNLHNKYLSGGEGYFIRRNAAEQIIHEYKARLDNPTTDAEDVMMGQAMEDFGIPLCSHPQFRKNQDGRQYPTPDNDLITAHLGFVRNIKVKDREQPALFQSIHHVFYPDQPTLQPPYPLCPPPTDP